MSLDRTAIERVLARAAELQSRETSEVGTLLSDDQIIELGKEVGLTSEALRQAIAEERGRVERPPRAGLAGAWFGVDRLSATRVVRGTPSSVLASLDTLFRGELPFEVKRRFPDRLMWEPKNSFLDSIRASFSSRVEGGDLSQAEEVSALVLAVDGERTHVRLDAVLSSRRRSAVGNSMAMVTVSGVGAFVLSAMAVAPLIVLPLTGAAAAAAVFVPRGSYERAATRVELALQQVLDRMEYGPAKRRGLAGDIVQRLLGPEA